MQSLPMYAFLGPRLANLEDRLLRGFRELGYDVALHPGVSLLAPRPAQKLCLALHRTPPNLPRVHPGAALLISFDYAVSTPGRPDVGWPPRRVRKHRYEICTRTCADSSEAARTVQFLTVALLASLSGGQAWTRGDEAALDGAAALARAQQAGETEALFDAGCRQFHGAWPRLRRDDEDHEATEQAGAPHPRAPLGAWLLGLLVLGGLALVACASAG